MENLSSQKIIQTKRKTSNNLIENYEKILNILRCNKSIDFRKC